MHKPLFEYEHLGKENQRFKVIAQLTEPLHIYLYFFNSKTVTAIEALYILDKYKLTNKHLFNKTGLSISNEKELSEEITRLLSTHAKDFVKDYVSLILGVKIAHEYFKIK